MIQFFMIALIFVGLVGAFASAYNIQHARDPLSPEPHSNIPIYYATGIGITLILLWLGPRIIPKHETSEEHLILVVMAFIACTCATCLNVGHAIVNRRIRHEREVRERNCLDRFLQLALTVAVLVGIGGCQNTDQLLFDAQLAKIVIDAQPPTKATVQVSRELDAAIKAGNLVLVQQKAAEAKAAAARAATQPTTQPAVNP